MAKRGEFFPYRIHFSYPPSERAPGGIEATNVLGSVEDVAREAADLLRRGATVEAYLVEQGSRARTTLLRLAPADLDDTGENEGPDWYGRDHILALLKSGEPRGAATPHVVEAVSGELVTPSTEMEPASRGAGRTGNLIRAWLAEQRSTNTRTAYRKDLDLFAAFLSDHGVPDVLDTRRAMAAAWADSMRTVADEDGNRVIGEATIARRLAAVSSFLTYAVDVEAIEANPVAKMKRPRISADSDGTVWLDTAGMKAFLAAAAAHSPRAYALAALMLTTGARISEALSADVDDLGHTGGHRVLTVTRKGGKRQNLPLAPWVGTALDAYLAERTDGPLFATSARAGGYGRLDQPAVHRLIRKVATAAGLPNAETLHPHSLRHSAITGALEAGGSLRDVQAMAGHVDPRTTERYDRMRGRLDASPVYALAATLAD